MVCVVVVCCLLLAVAFVAAVCWLLFAGCRLLCDVHDVMYVAAVCCLFCVVCVGVCCCLVCAVCRFVVCCLSVLFVGVGIACPVRCCCSSWFVVVRWELLLFIVV